MSSKTVFFSKTHFHIRWSAGSALDWEAFGTRVEADVAARQLAHTHECYSIEERNEPCERCATFCREKLGSLKGTPSSAATESAAAIAQLPIPHQDVSL